MICTPHLHGWLHNTCKLGLHSAKRRNPVPQSSRTNTCWNPTPNPAQKHNTVVSVLTTRKLQFITEQDRSESCSCQNCLKSEVASMHHWEIKKKKKKIIFKVPTMPVDKFIRPAYKPCFQLKTFWAHIFTKYSYRKPAVRLHYPSH